MESTSAVFVESIFKIQYEKCMSSNSWGLLMQRSLRCDVVPVVILFSYENSIENYSKFEIHKMFKIHSIMIIMNSIQYKRCVYRLSHQMEGRSSIISSSFALKIAFNENALIRKSLM